MVVIVILGGIVGLIERRVDAPGDLRPDTGPIPRGNAYARFIQHAPKDLCEDCHESVADYRAYIHRDQIHRTRLFLTHVKRMAIPGGWAY